MKTKNRPDNLEPVTVTIADQRDLRLLSKSASLCNWKPDTMVRVAVRLHSQEVIGIHKELEAEAAPKKGGSKP